MITELSGRHVDDASAAALAELETALYDEVVPGDPPVPAAEVADDLRHAPAFQEDHLWLSPGPDGRLLGASWLHVEDRPEHPTLAYPEVWVHPDARRAGLGRALLRPLAERSLELGRPDLLGYAWHQAGEAFGAAVGATTGIVEHCNRLRTDELDRALLTGWVARAAERASAYSLVAIENPCPDELVDHVVTVLAAMNDAPRAESMPEFVFTAGELRQREDARAAKGQVQWTLVARHDASGEPAGVTELGFPKHRPWIAHQGDTGVLSAHRDHGLGRWLKAANLLRLLDERPEVRVVETFNATSNAPMLGINHALGFRRAWTATEQEVDARALLEVLLGSSA